MWHACTHTCVYACVWVCACMFQHKGVATVPEDIEVTRSIGKKPGNWLVTIMHRSHLLRHYYCTIVGTETSNCNCQVFTTSILSVNATIEDGEFKNGQNTLRLGEVLLLNGCRCEGKQIPSQSMECGLCMFSLCVCHPLMIAVKCQHKEIAVTSSGLQCITRKLERKQL